MNPLNFGDDRDYDTDSDFSRICVSVQERIQYILGMIRIQNQGPYSLTIYRRLRIGRDGHLDQSEAYDIS